MERDLKLARERIAKSKLLGQRLNEELLNLVPSVFQAHPASGMGFQGLWQQTQVHTDQLTPENEALEIEKMVLEAKRVWFDLMVFSLKQGRTFRLVSEYPAIEVIYFERPSGEMQYVGHLRAAFATEEEIQNPEPPTGFTCPTK